MDEIKNKSRSSDSMSEISSVNTPEDSSNESDSKPSVKFENAFQGKIIDNMVRETAAKLALQSAEGHDTRTGRRLQRFGEKMTKKVATNEFEKNKALDKSMDTKKQWTNVIDFNKKAIYRSFSEMQVKGKHLRDMEVTETLVTQSIGTDMEMTPMDIEFDKIDDLSWDQLMVEIRGLNFSYSRGKRFMNNLNMSVPTGAIYGLLGPSGCGKTSLLKMILGLKKPNSGSVKVNGRIPGQSNDIPGIGVGYMPQELALFQELTLSEVLTYFSKIYGLTDKEINNRINTLVSFLDLPDPDRRISQMSGGQQRRVSLSISLVHNPPLLILDEPTVGTDPVLRERIWDHLIVLSLKESTTVIITTHYIEEARRAHVVSFMRDGNILVEHSPPALLAKMKLNNMEDVFLKLCRSQGTNASELPQSYYLTRNENKPIDNGMITSVRTSPDRRTKIKTVEVRWNNRIMAQTKKNYLRLIRLKTLLVFQTVLPAICIIIFAVCIGTKPTNLKVGVYNAEYSEENFANKTGSLMSMTLLESIDKRTILLTHYKSRDSAIEAVAQDNSVFGTLIFNEHFSQCLIQRVITGLSGTPVPEDVIENSTVLFYGDFTDMVITQTLSRALYDAQIKFQRTIISEKIEPTSGSNSSTQESMFDPLFKIVDPPIYGSSDPQFRDFMAPGIILGIIFILATGLTALTLVIERKEGLMERAQVAGLRQTEIMGGQLILQFCIVCVQVTLLLIFAFLVFRITIKGNIFLIISLVLLQGISGMSFGLVISAIASDENIAIMAALGTFYPQLLLSGIIWPLEGMPTAIKEGWGLSYTYVYAGFLSSIAWICIFLSIAYIAMKFRENPDLIFMWFRKK